MDKIYYESLLFDFYGEMLTDRQRDILRLYVEEDLSLSEIAEIRGISRQGASDAIHKGTKVLYELENKLHMTDRFLRIGSLIDKLEEETSSVTSESRITDIIHELREALAIGMDQE